MKLTTSFNPRTPGQILRANFGRKQICGYEGPVRQNWHAIIEVFHGRPEPEPMPEPSLDTPERERCPHDTDGDGDCHLCTSSPSGLCHEELIAKLALPPASERAGFQIEPAPIATPENIDPVKVTCAYPLDPTEAPRVD